MPYLDNFNYQILGSSSAPKLVFLHGLMGTGANWRRITPAFTETYQILLFDQRGHGRSFQPQSGYSPENYAQDLRIILEELDWQNINIVGHSMGGRNALVFADLYPECVSKLVIEDIGPDLNHEAGEKIKKLISLVPVPFANKREAREFFEGPFLKLTQSLANPQVLSQYFYTNIAENSQKLADWRFYKAGIMESLDEGRKVERWKEWERLQMPVLLIRGEYSQELYSEVYEEMLQRNPRVQGKVIADCGHWVHAEKPDEFIQILSNFLTS